MPDFTASIPEKEEGELVLPDAGLIVKDFTEYSFNSNFLTPTDGWSFTIGDEKLSDEMQEALKPNARIQLQINDSVQATGYIDSVEIEGTRSGGSQWHIGGRDV